MVTALLVGLVVGFVMVMPPGPIAMACMRQALAGHTREGLALVLGAAVMDSGYALLAAFASSALVEALWDMMMHHAWALLAFQGGCIVVLVVVGLHYCRSSRHGGAARARPEARGRLRGDVSPALRGVLLALTNLANPTVPALLDLCHEPLAGPRVGGARGRRSRHVCPGLRRRRRALVRAAAQDRDPPPGAVLPDGHAHAGQSGGRGVAPVRRAADLYRGDDDGMVTPAGMVNGLHIRISGPSMIGTESWDRVLR